MGIYHISASIIDRINTELSSGNQIGFSFPTAYGLYLTFYYDNSSCGFTAKSFGHCQNFTNKLVPRLEL